MHQAQAFMRMGKFSLARSLLTEALLHSKAWQDAADHGTCLHLLARLAHLDGKIREAVRLNAASVAVQKEVLQDVGGYVEAMRLRALLMLESESLERVFAVEEELGSALGHARAAVLRRGVADDTQAALCLKLEQTKANFDHRLVECVVQYGPVAPVIGPPCGLLA